MAKKKQKSIKQIKREHWGRVIRGIYLPKRYKPDLRVLTLKKRVPQPFLRHEPALRVRTPTTPIHPTRAPLAVTETPTKLYRGFQRVERVISCERKRERRRRAFFGYLNAPRATGVAAKIRKSPRSDRFTVKC